MNKKNKFFCFVLLWLTFLSPLGLYSQINSPGDWQLWWWNFVRVKISPNWMFVTTTEMRWGDDVSKLFYTYIQPQFIYSLNDFISTGPCYRQAERRYPLDSSCWVEEYSPMLDLIFNARFHGWEIAQRNRIEYNISKWIEFPWLYRNRIICYTPWHASFLKLTPFIAEEFFWRQGEGINEVRLDIGLKQTYTSHFGTEVYYMAHFEKSDEKWCHQNVINLVLDFSY